MTDQRARAEVIAGKLKQTYSVHDAVIVIERALADARREAWEEAAKLMCSYCNDPQWPRSEIVQGQAVHVGPLTGSLFPCNAMQIHVALRAKAHADQEQP